MRLLYTMSILLGAALIFFIEPMIAKMLLFRLGGSPAVWNTCTMFFQAALLGGYAYAHGLTRISNPRRQVVVHSVLLLTPLVLLPVGVPPGEASPNAPISWLLGMLLVSIGPPMFLVSTTSPLLQRWFSETDDPSAHDPYFLYAASNAGSALVLILYPFAIERLLPLGAQSRLWSLGYVGLVGLTVACGVARLRHGASPDALVRAQASESVEPLGWRTRGRFILLSFIPSVALLAVTQFVTTDIVSIPLFWVVPLFLYLLTFIVAFRRPSPRITTTTSRVLPLLALGLALLFQYEVLEPGAPLVVFHLTWLFVTALLCHGRLALERPKREHLTEFYLLLGLGGVLGGIFSSLVAPLLFSSLLEYPIAIALACALRVPSGEEPALGHSGAFGRWARTFAAPLVLLGLLMVVTPALARAGANPWWSHAAHLVSAGVILATVGDRVGFTLSLAVLLASGATHANSVEEVLSRERTFFGVHRVTYDPARNWNKLRHGTTVHGLQDKDPAGAQDPRLYYHREGPAGTVFAELASRPGARVAIVGLGVGALAAYGEPGQEFTFFEIDPAIVRIARDEGAFTYLRACKAQVNYVLGDARAELARDRGPPYDALVLDAFLSDSIPMHLVTREALALYVDRLSPGGLIVLHVSNRYLDLVPVLGAIARELDLVSYVGVERSSALSEAALEAGKVGSTWVALARDPAALARLRARDARWHAYEADAGTPVWTDDFSDVLWALRLSL